ncbi:MAG: hypothetical protein U0169_20350 [Polyangiaceae bacterium]
MGSETREDGVTPERAALVDARQQVEGVFEVPEAATERERVFLIAEDEDVDERVTDRDAAHDTRREGHGRIEERGLRSGGVRVEDDGDPTEELLLEFAHDGEARLGPTPRVEIAHRIAGSVGTNSEQIHGIAALLRELHAARMEPPAHGRVDGDDVGHLGDDEEAATRSTERSPEREPQRHHGRDAEGIEMVLATFAEARGDVDARGLSRGERGHADPLVLVRPVPRKERAMDDEALVHGRSVVPDRDGEGRPFADGHARWRVDDDRNGRERVRP